MLTGGAPDNCKSCREAVWELPVFSHAVERTGEMDELDGSAEILFRRRVNVLFMNIIKIQSGTHDLGHYS